MEDEIIFNIDVMLAKRKMSVTELSQKVGITMANISILKNAKIITETYKRLIRAHTIPFCKRQGKSLDKWDDHKNQEHDKCRKDKCKFLDSLFRFMIHVLTSRSYT